MVAVVTFPTILDSRLQAFAAAIKAKFDAIWLQLNAVIFDVAYPELYGAKGDGVTNDSAALQSAFSSGKRVKLRKATYFFTSALTIGDGTSSSISSVHGISIEGRGAGASLAEFAPRQCPSRLKWGGAAGATMLTVNGPITAVTLKGFCLDCNSLAATSLKTNHLVNSYFEDILFTRYTGECWVLEAYDTFTGMVQGANNNTFINVRGEEVATGGCGFRVGVTLGMNSNTMLDVAQNEWINCKAARDGTNASSYSLKLAFTDNCSFYSFGTPAVGGSLGYAVMIVPPSGSASHAVRFPHEISFYNSPLEGGFSVDGSWAPVTGGILCMPYPTSDGEAVPTSPFIIGTDYTGRWFGSRSWALAASATPANNSDLTIQLTSNTSLTFKVKGSDGTVRSASLTLS